MRRFSPGAKWLLRLTSILIFLSPGPLFAKGGEVGSGGDTVLCEVSPDNPFRGYYSLDYMLTHDESEELVPVESWEGSRDRLLSLLRQKHNDLADSFTDFVLYLDNHSDYLLPRIWEKASYGLVELTDQQIIRRLPPNCYGRKSPDTVNIIQTVIRQRKPAITIYNYAGEIFDRLKVGMPLQFSFLLVHEWLWDHTTDVDVIRRVDRLLHSRRVEGLSPEQFRATLENMGLLGSFLPVCDRSPVVKNVIEWHEKKPCAQIDHISTHADINFRLTQLGLQTLRPGDFSGTELLARDIDLSDNLLQKLPEELFHGLQNLWSLNLCKNQLETLYPRTFEGIHPNRINLSDNRLTTLPPDLFSRMEWTQDLDLSRNRLETLPPQLFVKARGLSVLHLGGNRLHELPPGVFDSPTLKKVMLEGNPLSEACRAELRKRYGSKVSF